MMNHKLAQDFIDKMKHLFSIDLTMTNEKGIVIGSSQLQRVGTFYAVAYKMLQQHINTIAEKDAAGFPSGINILLQKESTPYGVISISGPASENEKIIQLLRYFFEEFVEKPLNLQPKPLSQQDTVFSSLFLEKPINYTKVLMLFHQIHRDPQALRIPILVHLANKDNAPAVYDRIKAYLDNSPQNLLFKVNDYDFLLFIETTYQEPFTVIIADLTQELEREGSPKIVYKIACTVPTDDISTYVLAYSQLIWLKELYALTEKTILNVVDALDLLIISSDSWDNYNNILSYYQKKLESFHATDDFLQLAEMLIKHNMNYKEAAQAMFVHKNTIIFRMNKLKSILGINPYGNTDHLALFSYLYYYIRLDNHTLLSFQKVYDKYHS